VRSMVAQTMRGGDGVAPWAVTGGRGDDAASGEFGVNAMHVRRVRKNVTFREGDVGANETDGGGNKGDEGG